VETRYVPDAPATWLVYDFGTLVLALPSEFRAAADAIAAQHSEGTPSAGITTVLAALDASGIAEGAPFAVLESTAAGLAVALRGPATIAAGAQTLTGLGAEPRLERLVAGVAVARLTVPGGEWTFTLTPAPQPVPQPVPAAMVTSAQASVPATESPFIAPPFESSEITAFPDIELSLPPLPAPPSLGLSEDDDRTVLASDLAGAKADADASAARDKAGQSPATQSPATHSKAPDGTPADDKTVVVDEIAKLRAKRSAGLAPPTTPTGAPASSPAAAAVVAAAPAAARPLSLELPDGSRQPLDAVVLMGRAPSAPAAGPASRLVRLTGDGDISRNHARVAVEGGTVVVTDLGSRNGTIVRIPGRPAQKLREGEPTPVLVDTVIDFGGGIEVSVREG
jgi:hypothetical protein